jgi:hypothetical protein
MHLNHAYWVASPVVIFWEFFLIAASLADHGTKGHSQLVRRAVVNRGGRVLKHFHNTEGE